MASTGEVANLLLESESTVVLTGAGVSTASGMPVFRGADGLWSDPATNRWAHRAFFDKDPARWYKSFWPVYDMHQDLAPSAGHYALRDMVEASVIDEVVTQNIDGLDLLAGTPEAKLLEVHGHDRSLSCADWNDQGCEYGIDTEEWLAGNDRDHMPLPFCPNDGDPLKPDIILIDDTYVPAHVSRAYQQAPEVIEAADTLIVVGTSLQIRPWHQAACNIGIDKDKSLVVINPHPGPADQCAQLIVREKAEEALPALRDLTVSPA